ncbi:MAG TPA: LytR C-terminal domain-containing protein [Demequinaceae bacterium]
MSRNPQDPAPVAAHRLAPRGWTRIFTFLLVFALFGGIAYGGIWYLDHNGKSWKDWIPFLSSGEPSPSPSASASATPGVTASPSPSPSVAKNYDLTVRVTIYNASGNPALGSDIAALLAADGRFKQIDTLPWSGALPPGNVVRFENPDLSDTANLVSQILKIQTVASGPTSGPAIAVILVSDPRAQPKVTPSPGASPSASP